MFLSDVGAQLLPVASDIYRTYTLGAVVMVITRGLIKKNLRHTRRGGLCVAGVCARHVSVPWNTRNSFGARGRGRYYSTLVVRATYIRLRATRP